jgi:hypothetical protein
MRGCGGRGEFVESISMGLEVGRRTANAIGDEWILKKAGRGGVVGFKGLCCGIVKNKVRAMADKTRAVMTCRFVLVVLRMPVTKKSKGEHAIVRFSRARTGVPYEQFSNRIFPCSPDAKYDSVIPH